MNKDKEYFQTNKIGNTKLIGVKSSVVRIDYMEHTRETSKDTLSIYVNGEQKETLNKIVKIISKFKEEEVLIKILEQLKKK